MTKQTDQTKAEMLKMLQNLYAAMVYGKEGVSQAEMYLLIMKAKKEATIERGFSEYDAQCIHEHD